MRRWGATHGDVPCHRPTGLPNRAILLCSCFAAVLTNTYLLICPRHGTEASAADSAAIDRTSARFLLMASKQPNISFVVLI